MSEQEAQKIWGEYHERIKSRRLAEAKIINLELEKNSITREIDLILDFSFFTKDEAGAKGIQYQLSENYEMSITKNGVYWIIDGTSRPYVVNFTSEQHLGWVGFMHDVALSYGCIFSTWSITEPKNKHVWSNENIETDFD
ncbi:MAG: hypothetical protein V7785_00135 [Bermanella sp.]